MCQRSGSDKHKLLLGKVCQGFGRAVFLDRDGVLIEDVGYISEARRVMVKSGAKEFLMAAKEYGYDIVIVTNQSGIERGYYTWVEYEQVTKRMLELMGDSGLVDAIYANGSSTSSGYFSWRKPGIGMLSQASVDLKIDLSRSIMIGDRMSDLIAGRNAGIRLLVHLETSKHGINEKALVQEWSKGQLGVECLLCKSLFEAKDRVFGRG